MLGKENDALAGADITSPPTPKCIFAEPKARQKRTPGWGEVEPQNAMQKGDDPPSERVNNALGVGGEVPLFEGGVIVFLCLKVQTILVTRWGYLLVYLLGTSLGAL